MGESKILYQTLEDRGNHDYVEEHGPFLCVDNPWLGDGYYFWDSFIELAHWWGRVIYEKKRKKYIICHATCDVNSSNCFDLVGNTEHLKILNECIKLIEEKFGIKRKETTVARIINFIREVVDFDYEAIRVNGRHSISDKDEMFNKYYRVKFDMNNKPQYLELVPPIQFCLLSKDGLNLKNFKKIHP